jgi:hypothetical protein
MKRRRRIGSVVVFTAIVIYFSAGVAATVGVHALAKAPERVRSKVACDAAGTGKDLLLDAIRLGQRILVLGTKEYAELTSQSDPV